MNKIFVIGNLTKEPELRTTTSGISVCSFSVAVNRSTGKESDFFKVNAWRGLGETCAKYLTKGKKVAVIGELQLKTWEGKNGKQTTPEIQASEVEFLSAKEKATEMDGWTDINPNELPF